MAALKVGMYKYASNWSASDTANALRLIHASLPEIYPLSIPIGQGHAVNLPSPESFSRASLPNSIVDESPVFLSFRSHAGIRIDVSENEGASLRPGVLLMTIPHVSQVAHPGLWDFIAGALQVNAQTAVAGDAELFREMHRRALAVPSARAPLAVCWLNYWCPEWVSRLTADELSSLRAAATRIETLPNGALVFALQDEPYESDNPFHRRRREHVEAVLHLESIQRRLAT